MQCEICLEHFIKPDKHHIKSKAYGGKNKGNLCTVCPNCHRLVHLGEIIIEGRYATTKGNILFWHKKGEDYIVEEKKQECYILGQYV